jgi:hypothetical protein
LAVNTPLRSGVRLVLVGYSIMGAFWIGSAHVHGRSFFLFFSAPRRKRDKKQPKKPVLVFSSIPFIIFLLKIFRQGLVTQRFLGCF